jgi:hypothetical protein
MMPALLKRTDAQLAVRSQIDSLEAAMRDEIEKGNLEQTINNCSEDFDQASHYFAKGVYARSLLIPAGTCVVGKLHNFSRICIVASGTCTFINEFEKQTVSAPWVGEFKEGSKTAVLAHEDCLWVAVHGTEFTDKKDLLTLVSSDHEEYKRFILTLEDKT